MTDPEEEESTADPTAGALGSLELPIVEPPDRKPSEHAIDGVLLAAGRSTRFGEENKLTTTVADEPMVARAARTLARSSVRSVVVVLGHEADAVREALSGFDVEFVVNDAYREGQGTSVAAGARALRERDAEAGVFALGDMPTIDPSSVDALIAAYQDGAGSALAAAYRGRRGNPVLFDSRYFSALSESDGDVGGRDVLVNADDAALVETGDPGVRRDVDTQSDLTAVAEEDA